MIEAYPLQWPLGKPRSKYGQRSRFDTTLGKAIRAVQDQVRQLGGSMLIISSNLSLKLDGIPYANQREPDDAGVAVYFTYKKKQMCFACDRWKSVTDNMWAISKTIDALRGIERWGSGDMVQQAFTGFIALPSPEQWFQVLGVGATAAKDEIEQAHRRLAMQHHPDRGGDTEQMAKINAARDRGLEQIQ